MPQPSFRSYLGIAKDTVETYLTAAVAAGATTITISGTAVAAGSTIVIVDGPLTESRLISAGGGTSTLTVPALTYAHNVNTYVYAQATVGPVDFIPVTGMDFEDKYMRLDDKGMRGSNVEVYDHIDGVTASDWSVSGDLFPDTIGYWLGGVLGAIDFAGGTPNVHTIATKNTGDGQPTPFLLYVFDVTNTRAYASAKVEDLNIKLDPAGLLTYTAKGKAFASGVVANPTSSFSTLPPQAGWTIAATVGGASVNTLLQADVALKRKVEVLHTLDGAQGPYKIWGGQVSASGKLTFVMEDDSQLNNFINNSKPALDLSFLAGTGATQTGLALNFAKAGFKTGKPVYGKDYIELPVDFDGLANTTNANTAGTGYSPVKATLRNAKATATYQ